MTVSSRSSWAMASLNPLMHTKGYAAPETKAAVERARLLIEKAEARGEHLEDPLLLFSVLYGAWIANFCGVRRCRDAGACCAVSGSWPKSKGPPLPLVIGHRLVGASLVLTGDIAESRVHYDQAARSLRSHRTSPVGDTVRARRWGCSLIVSVIRPLHARLLRSRRRRCGTCTYGCARDWPSCHFDVRTVSCELCPYLVRQLRHGNRANR